MSEFIQWYSRSFLISFPFVSFFSSRMIFSRIPSPSPSIRLNYSQCHNIHKGCGEKWDERFAWCSDHVSLLLCPSLFFYSLSLSLFHTKFPVRVQWTETMKKYGRVSLSLSFNPFALLLIVSLILHLFLMLGEEEEERELEWRTK